MSYKKESKPFAIPAPKITEKYPSKQMKFKFPSILIFYIFHEPYQKTMPLRMMPVKSYNLLLLNHKLFNRTTLQEVVK